MDWYTTTLVSSVVMLSTFAGIGWTLYMAEYRRRVRAQAAAGRSKAGLSYLQAKARALEQAGARLHDRYKTAEAAQLQGDIFRLLIELENPHGPERSEPASPVGRGWYERTDPRVGAIAYESAIAQDRQDGARRLERNAPDRPGRIHPTDTERS